jgi:hypothetical protein
MSEVNMERILQDINSYSIEELKSLRKRINKESSLRQARMNSVVKNNIGNNNRISLLIGETCIFGKIVKFTKCNVIVEFAGNECTISPYAFSKSV